MNLGKMGIQICEKLRESLGWRQIGLCHKWDSEGWSTGPSGDLRYMHTAHNLSIKTLPRLLAQRRKHQTSDNSHQASFLSLSFFLRWLTTRSIIYSDLSLNRESHSSAANPDFSLLCFRKEMQKFLWGNL